MIVFTVIALAPNEKVENAVTTKFPDDHLRVSDTTWLVAGTGTAQELSTKLGITGGRVGSAIVFSTAGYYGRAPSNIWEWIKAKLEASVDA
jgi:hypothetical protein